MNEHLAALLLDDDCHGVEAIRLLGRRPWYDEDALPFELHGGGTVFRVVPQTGFRKEHLAAHPDEAMVISDCPDAEGWLVPEGVLAGWLDRHVAAGELEDVVASHPLYAYLLQVDERGHGRGGLRGGLLHWTPGIPEAVAVRGPEWLPNDADAPDVQRDPEAHVDALGTLLDELVARFRPLEIGLELRIEPPRRRRR